MAYNKVVIAGINTSELEVLKEDEKITLLKEIRATGSKSARDKLVNGNLRLVLSVIQRFTGRGEDIDDLFQIGVIGLIKAINNFDLSKEVRFSTYCVPMINGELRRYLRDNSHVKVSRSLRDLAYKAIQAKERLTFLQVIVTCPDGFCVFILLNPGVLILTAFLAFAHHLYARQLVFVVCLSGCNGHVFAVE